MEELGPGNAFWIGLTLVGFTVAILVYRLARSRGRMALVDLIWTMGLGLSAIVYYLLGDFTSVRAFVVCLVVALWSFRLSLHLFRDRVLSESEDPRYRSLARKWGTAASRNFLLLFLVQVPFVLLFLFPVTLAMRNPGGGWSLTDTLAVALALVALAGEFLADRQLAHFRAAPGNKGGVCRRGLWRYSRHPNYFFEWLHWWAYVLFAWGVSNWWLTLSGPVAMYVFLRFLTGIPHAERSSVLRRGRAYRQYQESTNAFFPWKPHKDRS